MPRRRTARRRALDILYQADVTQRAPSAVLAERASYDRSVPVYAREVVAGVEEHLAEIDRVLGEHAHAWTVDRMATVDRTILRLAVYELMFREDIPERVAISEAVEAAKELSTDESRGFVNGVLGRIARERAETA